MNEDCKESSCSTSSKGKKTKVETRKRKGRFGVNGKIPFKSLHGFDEIDEVGIALDELLNLIF